MSKYPVGGYGEVKDLLDKIKMFSNLRIHAYESGLRGSGSIVAREADDLLEQIEKDLDKLVELMPLYPYP